MTGWVLSSWDEVNAETKESKSELVKIGAPKEKNVIQRSGKLEKERQLRKVVDCLKQNTLTDDEKNAKIVKSNQIMACSVINSWAIRACLIRRG